MAIFLDTRGKPTLAIAICARCSVKYPRDDLRPDPNSPGLMCCPDGCIDQFDPYRLAPRAPDKIALEWSRPDVPVLPGPMSVPVWPLQAGVGIDPGSPVGVEPVVLEVGLDQILGVGLGLVLQVGETAGTTLVPAPGLSLIEALTGTGIAAAEPVSTVLQPVQWTPNTYYRLGAQVVPIDPTGDVAESGAMFQVFTCVYPGLSGSVAPTWPTREGIAVESGDAFFISQGFFLP